MRDPGALGITSGGPFTPPPVTMLWGDDGLGNGQLDAYTAFDRATGARLWTTKLGAPDTMVVQGPPRGAASEQIVVVLLGPSASICTTARSHGPHSCRRMRTPSIRRSGLRSVRSWVTSGCSAARMIR